MTAKTAWLASDGGVWLHPPFSDPSPRRAEVTLRGADWMPGGEWWPTLRMSTGDVIVSRILPSILDSVRPFTAHTVSSAPAPNCDVSPRRLNSAPGSLRLGRADIDRLLAEPLAASRSLLVAEYPHSALLRRVVEEVILSAGRDLTPSQKGAFSVAARVGDGRYWESLSVRARQGDSYAEYVLARWPDPRGVELFAEAFAPEKVGLLEKPSVLSALTFFVLCCDDCGWESVVHYLGDPWRDERRERIIFARNMLGEKLGDAEADRGDELRGDWNEYLSALLLGTPVLPESGGSIESAVAFLRRRGDPRVPVVVSQLVRNNVDIGAELLLCFRQPRTTEATEVGIALQRHVAEMVRSAGQDTLDFLEGVHADLQQALV